MAPQHFAKGNSRGQSKKETNKQEPEKAEFRPDGQDLRDQIQLRGQLPVRSVPSGKWDVLILISGKIRKNKAEGQRVVRSVLRVLNWMSFNVFQLIRINNSLH